jgi:hypothetical protein
MAHGLRLVTYRHPPFRRITGEMALNITAILIIALFVLVLLFWTTLGYL